MGGQNSHGQPLVEAQAAVHLAATVVQLLSTDALTLQNIQWSPHRRQTRSSHRPIARACCQARRRPRRTTRPDVPAVPHHGAGTGRSAS